MGACGKGEKARGRGAKVRPQGEGNRRASVVGPAGGLALTVCLLQVVVWCRSYQTVLGEEAPEDAKTSLQEV